jgi:hypothetical protein
MQAARDYLKKEGSVEIDEDKIFGAVRKMRDIIESSTQKTKKSRRSLARKKSAEKKSGTYIEKPAVEYSEDNIYGSENISDEEILPFDEMEEVHGNG